MPWYARLFATLMVGYAFSPIDLIPGLIPVLGYLEDLFLIPPDVALEVRMISEDVLSENGEVGREAREPGGSGA